MLLNEYLNISPNGYTLLKSAVKNMIVSESLNNPKIAAIKTMRLMNEAYEIAASIIASLKNGKRDEKAIKTFNKQVEDMIAAAAWLQKHGATWAKEYAFATEAAKKLRDKSKFWNTPKFLNVKKHLREMQKLLQGFEVRKSNTLKTARLVLNRSRQPA